MSVFLSPVGGAAAQFFTDNGTPLTGGLLYTYQAGTTTPQATYTSSGGGTANTNPIVLDAAGRPPSEVWLTGGAAYKFVLKTSVGVLIGTWDNISGIDDTTSLIADLANTSNIAKGDALIGFKQATPISAIANAVARTVHDKLAEVVSVWDFIPTTEIAAIVAGTSTYDCTAAFNSAVASGKKVTVPNGTYLVADIDVVDGLTVQGESNSVLLVKTNSSGAFTSTSGIKNNIVLSDLIIGANTGVTGARAYKQIDKTTYTAFCEFNNIQTYVNLEISYDGYFIFTSWVNCKDGYSGSAVSGQTHQGVNSVPAEYGQGNQTNLNQFHKCQFFNASNPNGAVEIAYGFNWSFYDTDFEGNSCRAVKALGIYGLSFENCWFERNDDPYVIYDDVSPSPNPQGTRPVNLNNCYGFFMSSNVNFLYLGAASTGSVTNFIASNVPVGCTLTNATSVDEMYGIYALSGLGKDDFFANTVAARSQLLISNSEATDTFINAPSTQNQNILAIGPAGLGASNFTLAGTGSPALANVASQYGLTGQALELTMTAFEAYAYYTVATKVATFLAGKTVTLLLSGYGIDATTSDGLRAAIWVDVVPAGLSNATAVSGGTTTTGALNVLDTEIGRSIVTYTFPDTVTSVKVGFLVGGVNTGKKVNIEVMKMMLGEITPNFVGFY